MPEGRSNLVTRELCPFQAFRLPGQPTWAFQFHPELDVVTNRGRFTHSREGYLQVMTDRECERILAERFLPSPESERLPRLFLEEVFA